MAANLVNRRNVVGIHRNYFAGLFLMLGAVVVSAFLLVLNSDFTQSFPYFFLLPWIFLLVAVLLTPSFLLYSRGKFSFANPLVFAAWSYFFPAFVIGGVTLSIGWSHPYFLSYIQDPETNLPYTIVLIILGYVGLSIGYFLPIGASIGKFAGTYISRSREEAVAAYTIPGFVLLILGMLNSIAAIALGVFGYQEGREIAAYEGLVFVLTMFWLEATFLLWYVVFRHARLTAVAYMAIAVLILTSVFRGAISGSRASLLQSLIVIVVAFVLSGRKFSLKQSVLAAVMFCVTVLAGMIYGTTFRQVGVFNEKPGLESYAENVINTIDAVGRENSLNSIEFGLNTLAERLDVVSSLAVVVSNYEQLAPYEEGYDLDDNIRKDLATTFIPRLIWKDKPVASDARRYGALYFDYGENSFAMTPMGDLLRNFGVGGVVIGMLILGFLLRVTYSALIENQPPSVLRSTLYFMLLVSVNYEGFYGMIFSYFVKIGVAALAGVVLVSFLAKLIRRSSPST